MSANPPAEHKHRQPFGSVDKPVINSHPYVAERRQQIRHRAVAARVETGIFHYSHPAQHENNYHGHNAGGHEGHHHHYGLGTERAVAKVAQPHGEQNAVGGGKQRRENGRKPTGGVLKHVCFGCRFRCGHLLAGGVGILVHMRFMIQKTSFGTFVIFCADAPPENRDFPGIWPRCGGLCRSLRRQGVPLSRGRSAVLTDLPILSPF